MISPQTYTLLTQGVNQLEIFPLEMEKKITYKQYPLERKGCSMSSFLSS